MNKIEIFKTKDNQTEINVQFDEETVWLSQMQMAELFQKTKQNISLHINNCFKEGELINGSVVKEYLTTASDGKKYSTKYYNLDVIISVGYRVKSKRGTQFRQWSTSRLKEHLLNGYTINKKRLEEKEMEVEQLKSGISIFRRTIENQITDIDDAKKLSNLLDDFSQGLTLLDDYDHGNLDKKGKHLNESIIIKREEYMNLIKIMSMNFIGDIFGKEKDESFNSSINQVYQSFSGNELYPSIEEKAISLLYLIIKNHSFVDGNKRIAAACFLYFLEKNKILYNANKKEIISNDALAALTLFIAESKATEMNLVKRFALSILSRNMDKYP